MLGLADASRDHRPVRCADARRCRESASASCASQYDSGADPLVVLTELAEFTHFVTRVKVVPTVVEDRLARRDRAQARPRLAASLSMGTLSRTWQMLFKGCRRSRRRPARSRPRKWCWCASPMPPTCRPPEEVDPQARPIPRARTAPARGPGGRVVAGAGQQRDEAGADAVGSRPRRARPRSARPPLRTEPSQRAVRSEPLRASAQPALAAAPQAPQPVGRAGRRRRARDALPI